MNLQMNANDFLRLRCASGSSIEVLSGRLWVTEDGAARDALLGPGRRYRVTGDGLVLVGAESPAEARLKPAGSWSLWSRVRGWLLASATERELEGLSDRMLSDIGLRRDQIRGAAAPRL